MQAEQNKCVVATIGLLLLFGTATADKTGGPTPSPTPPPMPCRKCSLIADEYASYDNYVPSKTGSTKKIIGHWIIGEDGDATNWALINGKRNGGYCCIALPSLTNLHPSTNLTIEDGVESILEATFVRDDIDFCSKLVGGVRVYEEIEPGSYYYTWNGPGNELPWSLASTYPFSTVLDRTKGFGLWQVEVTVGDYQFPPGSACDAHLRDGWLNSLLHVTGFRPVQEPVHSGENVYWDDGLSVIFEDDETVEIRESYGSLTYVWEELEIVGDLPNNTGCFDQVAVTINDVTGLQPNPLGDISIALSIIEIPLSLLLPYESPYGLSNTVLPEAPNLDTTVIPVQDVMRVQQHTRTWYCDKNLPGVEYDECLQAPPGGGGFAHQTVDLGCKVALKRTRECCE